MNREEKRIALLLAVSIIAAIAIFLFQTQITGLLSLAPEKTETENHNQTQGAKISEKIGEKKTGPQENAEIGLKTTFEVLKTTQIKPKLIAGKLLSCPVYSELVFEVANFGKTAAERVFIKYPSDFKAKSCTNCKILQLLAGEKAEISFVACKAQSKEIELEFSSINAKKETIKVS